MIDVADSSIKNRIFLLVNQIIALNVHCCVWKTNVLFLLLLKCLGVLELSTLLKCFTAPTWHKACTLVVLNTNLGLFNACTISGSLYAMYSGCGLQIILFFKAKLNLRDEFSLRFPISYVSIDFSVQFSIRLDHSSAYQSSAPRWVHDKNVFFDLNSVYVTF